MIKIDINDKQAIDRYSFESKKITILWKDKVQPFGMFYSLNEAIIFLKNSWLNPEDFTFICAGEQIKLTDRT